MRDTTVPCISLLYWSGPHIAALFLNEHGEFHLFKSIAQKSLHRLASGAWKNSELYLWKRQNLQR